MKKPIPKLDKKKISSFCKRHHIISLAIFGSILTPQFNSKSDVDFLVKFKKKYTPTLFDMVDIEKELCMIVGRKVDLKTAEDLSCYFRDEVVAKAKIVYGK